MINHHQLVTLLMWVTGFGVGMCLAAIFGVAFGLPGLAAASLIGAGAVGVAILTQRRVMV